jgi:hypothetical protein
MDGVDLWPHLRKNQGIIKSNLNNPDYISNSLIYCHITAVRPLST